MSVCFPRFKMIAGVLHYKGKDFEREAYGVIYALGSTFGTRFWANPDSTKRIKASRSTGEKGMEKHVLEYDYKGESATKNKENSWWCVDLTEKYSLYLTHYSLRHGRKDGKYLLCNWRLEGSFDEKNWKTLREHKNDQTLKRSQFQNSWEVNGKLGAFRYFRIYQTGPNSSGSFHLYLSGIELYGVLIEMDVSPEDTTRK